jgi:hypothetical protein
MIYCAWAIMAALPCALAILGAYAAFRYGT